MINEFGADNPAVLPALEHTLVTAARARATRRPSRRRLGVSLALAGLLCATVAGAATGVIDLEDGAEVERGTSPSGAYVIRYKPKHAGPAGGDLCLQVRIPQARPTYGCGWVPSPERPFGVVIADPLDNGPQRLVYGLVLEEIATVALLGEGDDETRVETVEKPGLPGRYFSILGPGITEAPNAGRIELVGYAEDGSEIARIVSRETPNHKPLSHDDSVAQGDPAGFAPTVVPARVYTYKGQEIDPARADALGLVCVEGRAEVRCFDSIEETLGDAR